MRKSMKNTLKKQKRNGGTRKIRGGLGGALRPDFKNYGEIAKIGFDIPDDNRKKGFISRKISPFDISEESRIKGNQNFGHAKDYYKFLEMAQRNMVTDMKTMLHKIGDYEISNKMGGIHGRTEKMCKFMYLIRAQDQDTGASVLHHICNNGSIQMFDLVFPYYMTLYNSDFPQLLGYYLNLKSKEGKISPLELLINPIDRKGVTYTATGNAIRGTLGAVKNAFVNPLTSLKNAASTTASGVKRTFSGNNLNWERVRIYCLMRQFGASKPTRINATLYENEFKKNKNYNIEFANKLSMSKPEEKSYKRTKHYDKADL